MRIEAKVVHAQPEIFAPDVEESPITALALIETTPASLIYAPGALTSMVDRIKAEVRAQLATLDVSKPKDKARIISLSARVAKAKVKLDEMGDSLIEEHRAVVRAVNADRKIMRDDLDDFKVEVRKPVTDLENAEKERMAAHESALKLLEDAADTPSIASISDVKNRIDYVNQLAEREWEEFGKRAAQATALTIQTLVMFKKHLEEREAAIAEAKRLDEEARERAIKEREEAAARAAKEAAERRAEEQARIARETAERECQRIENERIEAEAKAKQAEAERIAAEERAEEQKFLAAERAKIALAEAEAREKRILEAAESARLAAIERAKGEQERAVEAERQRIAAEQQKEKEAAEARERNKAHRAKINGEAKNDLVASGIDAEVATLVVIAIAKGLVQHVKMEY